MMQCKFFPPSLYAMKKYVNSEQTEHKVIGTNNKGTSEKKLVVRFPKEQIFKNKRNLTKRYRGTNLKVIV